MFQRMFIQGCRSFYFHPLITSTFLVRKGLLCLYNKQNNRRLLVDMEFLFSCLTRHLTRSLRSLVSYRVEHSKRNSISTRALELFFIYERRVIWRNTPKIDWLAHFAVLSFIMTFIKPISRLSLA